MESQTIVFLQDVAFEELQMLVDFMYKGEIDIEYAETASFFETAQFLKIHGLMQHQGPEETASSVFLRVPQRQKEAECPAEASGHDSCQASGSNERRAHLQQVHNRLIPSVGNAVDINSLSQSPAGEEIQTEDSEYALESDNLQGEGAGNEENSITIMKEEILVPHYELFHPEEPPSFGAQDFNKISNAFANNSSSLALRAPKPAAKNRQKRTRLSRMRPLVSEKHVKAQRKRTVSEVPPGMKAKGNNADMSGDPDDEISPAPAQTAECPAETSVHDSWQASEISEGKVLQYEGLNSSVTSSSFDESSATSQNGQIIEVTHRPAARFEDSGTNVNEANDLGAKGPSRLAFQTPGQGISNVSSISSLPKGTSVFFQSFDIGSLPDTSRSALASSSVQSKNSKPTSRTTRHGNTPHFVCQQCSKSYKWPKDLVRHERLYCGKGPSFRCNTCDKRFYRKDLLKDHRLAMH